MAEKVVIGNAELWHGDCREVLPLLPACDLILTDPPYGIGFAAQPTDYQRKNGMERETEYFHGIAVPRVRAAASQPQLLPPAPQAVAEQQWFDLG